MLAAAGCSSAPCASCAKSCTAGGVSCKNAPPGVNGCGWWGCFQYDQIAPGQPNTNNHWKDNRVDYFFAHTAELVAAHSAGIFFGAGPGDQTSPESDGGNLLARVKAYQAAGGQPICK